ncbi:hypothetical protein ANO11243_014170 [Dothideomycetidae sp. 11243]|nr:hypothetical protein ANO11243_014170 [fungal sp. No.11243]
MQARTCSVTVEQTKRILALWCDEQVDGQIRSKYGDSQEPPRKRTKLEPEDESERGPIPFKAPSLSPASIPLTRLVLDSDFLLSNDLTSFQEPRNFERDSIEVSLIAVEDHRDGRATLGFVPLSTKGKKSRLEITVGDLQDTFIKELDLIAQLHLSVGVTHMPARGKVRFTLHSTIWWPDGASCLVTGGRHNLDGYVLEVYAGVPTLSESRGKQCSAQDFYDSVHFPSATAKIPASLNERVLTTELYPFQKRAVHWMLQREGVDGVLDSQHFPTVSELSKLSFKQSVDADGIEIFISTLEGVVASRARLLQRQSVRGGILSEEMGLGKTCEMLSLVCLNKRHPEEDISAFKDVGLLPTRATLIVTPMTILQQWKDEIERHAPHLVYTHYRGMAALTKDKQEEKDAIESFKNADIVLTTYNVLAGEIHYAVDPPDRSMRRKEKTRTRKRSPLVQMHWWRAVLDEAQMVESGVSNAAMTARLIPRYNAWAVSGTPVKRDVQDLRGLLIFLQYEPFASSNEVWRRLVSHYESHFLEDFKNLFGTIALRHTKDRIRSELKLPPQRRMVVTMPFTAVEEQNYQTLFEEMAYDCGLAVDGSPLADDWNPDDSRVVDRMREWLIRLRQTCLHPQVGGRNRRALGRSGAPLRTVDEVLAVMIDQNEAAIRTETRLSVNALCLKGHVLANAKDVSDRAEQSLQIYQSASQKSDRYVASARVDLEKAGGKGIDDVSDDGADDDDGDNSGHAKRGRLRNNLRTALELLHMCEFFVATAYFQKKSSTEGIAEGDDVWKKLEEQETHHYDKAKTIRKEILRESANNAERTMRDVNINEQERIEIKVPSMLGLGFNGGIESQRVLEKADKLSAILERQTSLLVKWRSKVGELLQKRLVDVEEEEITGEEYETSTKQQDEMYIYFDAYRAVVSDRSTCITGQINTLVNHEMDQLVTESRRADHDDELEKREPPETRQFLRKILAERKAIKQKDDDLISLRGLMHEARTVESSLQWLGNRSARSQAEIALLHRLMSHLQKLTDACNEVQPQLVKDQELFKAAMNQRLEFYRQLQQISDAVAPYKEELDDTLDLVGLQASSERYEHHEKQLATMLAKQRFLVHLRDESNSESERICVICQSTFEQGVLTVCGHQFCKECIGHWWRQHQTCPVCKRRLRSADFHNITYKLQELSAHEEIHNSSSDSDNADGETNDVSKDKGDDNEPSMRVYTSMSTSDLMAIKSIDLPRSRSFGTKIDTISRHLLYIRRNDPGSKTLIFSQYRDFLGVLSSALTTFGISHTAITRPNSITRFREDASIEAFLLDAKTDSSGLNLVNATNVMLCEPLVNPAIELQAIARVHRIGQTRPTSVFMYLVKDTVEQGVYQVSVARRMELLQQSRKDASTSTSRAVTPVPNGTSAVNGVEIDRAERLEMQAGGLERLMGKSGGEQVRREDLWKCLFGSASRATHVKGGGRHVHDVLGADNALACELGRFVRAEAAEARRAGH